MNLVFYLEELVAKFQTEPCPLGDLQLKCYSLAAAGLNGLCSELAACLLSLSRLIYLICQGFVRCCFKQLSQVWLLKLKRALHLMSLLLV